MKYARAAWNQERASWRAVIQLNLLRSILSIVETLQAEIDDEPITSRPLSPLDMNADALLRRSLDTTPSEVEAALQPLPIPLTEKHHILKLRLGPLRRVERDLQSRLGAAGTEELAGYGVGVLGEDASGSVSPTTAARKGSREFVVRGWKDALGGWMKNAKTAGDGEHPTVDDATEVIASCREDMKALWTDEAIKSVLAKRRLRVQDSAGLSVYCPSYLFFLPCLQFCICFHSFLNDLDRIATRVYQPSDDDVVRARLRTLGVQEYKIQFDQDSGSSFLASPY